MKGKFLWAGLLFVLLGASSVSAQVLYGSVTGDITDPSGANIPGTKVSLTNKETGASREATSDDAGRYSLLNVPAGTYELKATAQGFRTSNRTDVVVTINNVTRIDLKLEVGQMSEQVTVEASAAALQTDRSEARSQISGSTVAALPLPAYRNYQSLINLVPGATPAALQNAVADTPGRALTTNVNGTYRNNNNTRVDGATNTMVWLPHHTAYVQPSESIDEVAVTTASFDAEQGMAGGAAITVTTKSGTNDLHGVAFWYHDNQKLKARPYFYYPANNKLPRSTRNIMGGTIGGPIVKNKLFYFFSYERTGERTGQTGNYSVPTQAMRIGDFSALSGLSTLYDPATGNANGEGRQPFANNRIPTDRLSSIFTNIQKMAPLPNRPSSDIYGLQDNYTISGTQALDRDNYDVKVNYALSAKLNIWGKYSRMKGLVNGVGSLGELTGPELGTLGTGDTVVQLPTVGFNYTLSPTFLMDGIFGMTRLDQSVIGTDYGKNWGSEVWGIPGTNGSGQFANDPRYQGQPCINNGLTTWGNCLTWTPMWRNDRSYTYTTNFTKLKGAHEIRFGFDMVRHEMNHWQPETANPRGNIGFDGTTTTVNGGNTRSINTYAAGLLGLVNNYSKSVQFFEMKTREWQLGWYVRDTWRVNRQLTLNLGVRYEYYPLMNRGDRGLERWDPATNLVTLGGLGNVPSDNGYTVSKKLVAPRVGFAYRLNEKAVIRGGYGITYDPLPFSRPLRGLYPATITANFVAPTQYGYFNSLSQGIPTVPLPDISSGVLPLPATVDMGPRSPWGGQLHRGYIQSWNFTYEQNLPGDLIGSLAYVGNSTVHQLGDRDINAAAPGGGPQGRPLAATQGRLIAANMWDGFASANYHSLQTSLNKRLTKGLMLKGAYTWSKAINMFDDDGWVGLPLYNWGPMIKNNRAPAGYDRTHMFVMSFVYELPFGAGRHFNLHGAANAIAGGWNLSGIYSAYSGTPFTVTASSNSLNAPGNSQTADIISAPNKTGATGPGQPFYDLGAFMDPNYNLPKDVYRFGTSGRNTLRGPGFQKADVTINKTFALHERVKLEFKAEAYNLSNTPRFSNPNANVSSAVFTAGKISSANNFMSITATDALSERQFRFGLRLSF